MCEISDFREKLAVFQKDLEKFHKETEGMSFSFFNLQERIETVHFSDETGEAFDKLSDLSYFLDRYLEDE